MIETSARNTQINQLVVAYDTDCEEPISYRQVDTDTLVHKHDVIMRRHDAFNECKLTGAHESLSVCPSTELSPRDNWKKTAVSCLSGNASNLFQASGNYLPYLNGGMQNEQRAVTRIQTMNGAMANRSYLPSI